MIEEEGLNAAVNQRRAPACVGHQLTYTELRHFFWSTESSFFMLSLKEKAIERVCAKHLVNFADQVLDVLDLIDAEFRAAFLDTLFSQLLRLGGEILVADKAPGINLRSFFVQSLEFSHPMGTSNSGINHESIENPLIQDQLRGLGAIRKHLAGELFENEMGIFYSDGDDRTPLEHLLLEFLAGMIKADIDDSPQRMELAISAGNQIRLAGGAFVKALLHDSMASRERAKQEIIAEGAADDDGDFADEITSFSEDKTSPLGNETPISPPQDPLDVLQSLIGLDPVKQDVLTLVSTIKINQMRLAKGMPSLLASGHLVFYGNPGTGKTTVARLIGEIYRDLGLLKKGHLIEVDRSGLVAGFVGQTALKVKTVTDEAMGGVLFIDEAYTLAGGENDFGQEAIDALLKIMEDRREDLVVIVAGYTDKMSKFLDSNPGLRSRFQKHINFPDYSPPELLRILNKLLTDAHLTIANEAREPLLKYFEKQYACRDDNFGNGRLVRNLFDRLIANQAIRLANQPHVSEDELRQIVNEDISWLRTT